MAGERERSQINTYLRAHDFSISGFDSQVATEDSPLSAENIQTPPDTYFNSAGLSDGIQDTQPIDSFFAAKNEIDTEVSEEILDIFREDQEKAPFNRDIRYHLLDDSIPPANPHCPAQIIEDDYSAESFS